MDATTTTVLAVAASVACVLLVLALVVVIRSGAAARSRAEVEAAALREELLSRIERLEQPLPVPRQAGETPEFVITEMRDPGAVLASEQAQVPTRMEGRLFVDVVLRESVVKAASWTHGIRTALSPENRNRIRFEMKRETKRSTKQRKADTKEALRQYYARQDAEAQKDRP